MNWYKDIQKAKDRLDGVIIKTPLEFNKQLSDKYKSNIYLKREDLQEIRSYKIRGAYNKLSSLTFSQKKKGIVCASAGNHAQGVALSCALLKIKGRIYLPKNTSQQKISRINYFGKGCINLILVGDSFDETNKVAESFSKETGAIFIHPFNDKEIIIGQGTLGLDILEDIDFIPDYVFIPVGGGGLFAGISLAMREKHRNVRFIGVEPEGAASMAASFKKGKPVDIGNIDTFVDGAAVRKPGNLTFRICQKNYYRMLSIPNGRLCSDMIDLYQRDGIIAEPAGALSISALSSLKDQIRGKKVVCIVSGGNNDISRYSEMLERALIYKGLSTTLLLISPKDLEH